jgi:dethiobiotin synthetase
LTAARAENRQIDLGALRGGLVRLSGRFDFVAVEGVGGWIVPIAADYFSNDLAADLRLPVIVIAHNRLGCLNHILLTVRSIEAAGLTCAGVVLNNPGEPVDIASTTNAAILQRCLRLPIVEQFAAGSAEIPPALCQMLPAISVNFGI